MEAITKVALRSERIIFDINYKVQDLNLALLQLATEIENLNDKEYLRNEILETINQLLKFQVYVDKKRLTISKVYSLFEIKQANSSKIVREAKILKQPTKALRNDR